MLSVYRIVPDWDKYRFFNSDDEALLKWRFDGKPIGTQWQPLNVYVPYPLHIEGDFWGCFQRNAIFAVTPERRGSIESFLDQSCEQLPLEYEGRVFTIANVTHVVNCLNKKRSQYDPEFPDLIEQYVFHPRRFEFSLFKIPETRMKDVLCVEGIAGPEDEFKGAVEKYKLKGLRFDLLWTEGS
jgi:hypothetical protein